MRPARYAALLMVLASALFAITGVCIKLGADRLQLSELVFYRSFVGLLCLLPAVFSGHITLVTERPGGQVIRAVTGCLSMTLYFYAIVGLPLGTAVTLQYSSPIFVAILSVLYLRERINGALLSSILLGFAGVALIMRPEGLSGPMLAGVVGLASGLAAGVALFSVKLLSSTEPVGRIVFYLCLVSSLISAIWASIDGWSAIDGPLLPLLLGMGIPATLAQLLMTKAYQLAPASQMSALSYSTVGFAALFGLLLWDKQPDLLGWLGLAVLVIAGMMALRTAPAACRT